MKIKVIVDNNTFIDEYYCGEPAVSLYIEDEDVKILFDVGYSELFLRNMEQFKLNIEDIDVVVISHGHNDHTGGLKYLLKNGANKIFKLVGHSNAFEYKSDETGMISSPFNAEQLKKMCKLELTSKPMKVSNKVTNCDNVLGIIGGFHLFYIDEGLNKTIDFLKEHNIGELYPCHCTSFKVKAAINNIIDVQDVGVGLTLDWN